MATATLPKPKTTRKTTTTRKPAAKAGPTDKEVRAWARASGMEVQPLGRVNVHLVELYKQANGKVHGVKVLDVPATTKTHESASATSVTETVAKAKDTEFTAGRAVVFIVTDTAGQRTVLKSGNVFVDEIAVDDKTEASCMASLSAVLALPKSPHKATLIKALTERLTSLAAG